MLSNMQADEPAGILVMNFALGEGVVDNNSDFRLHYRCAAAFPPVCAISIPEFNACRFQSPGDPYVMPRCGDAGPGCSNSTYP
jgi:hypothetical protein